MPNEIIPDKEQGSKTLLEVLGICLVGCHRLHAANRFIGMVEGRSNFRSAPET